MVDASDASHRNPRRLHPFLRSPIATLALPTTLPFSENPAANGDRWKHASHELELSRRPNHVAADPDNDRGCHFHLWQLNLILAQIVGMENVACGENSLSVVPVWRHVKAPLLFTCLATKEKQWIWSSVASERHHRTLTPSVKPKRIVLSVDRLENSIQQQGVADEHGYGKLEHG